MLPVKAYAAYDANSPLRPFNLQRREVGPSDVLVDILYCGVCHSDIHFVRSEWGLVNYPVVPGHEIIGKIEKIGEQVKKFQVGQIVGVGCMVESCNSCSACQLGLQQYCERGATMTYGSLAPAEHGGITQGGYSTKIVVTQNFLLSIPSNLPLENAAPLLCAGITTYSPLRYWKVEKGQQVGVIGIGGLGHMAIKLAASMGAEVTVFSSSENKKADAIRLGAHNFIATKNLQNLKQHDPSTGGGQQTLNLILDTVSATHDYNSYLNFLAREGAMVLLGLPEPQKISAFQLISKRRKLAGSLIGGIPETQEMLNYCSAHSISADVEVIPIQYINEAYDRMMRSDVHYRFVIDMKNSSW